MDKDQQKRYDEYKSTNFTFQSIQKVRVWVMRGWPGQGLGLLGFSSFGFGFGVRLGLVGGKSICLGLVWSTWTIRGSILWFLYWIIRSHIHQPPRPPAHSIIPSPPPVPLARHTSTSHPTRRSIEIGTQAQDISPRMWLG